MTVHGERGQKPLEFRCAEIARVSEPVVHDELPHPMTICIFGAVTEVANATGVAKQVHQFG